MRDLASWCIGLALILSGCGERSQDSPASSNALAPSWFHGKFTGETPVGSVTMTLRQRGDIVEFAANDGETINGRLVAPDRVEIPFMDSGQPGEVILTLEGVDIRLRKLIKATNQVWVEEQDLIFKREGDPPISLLEAMRRPAGSYDTRIIGRWHHTPGHASGIITHAKDLYLVLETGGALEEWTRSATEVSEHVRGAWKVEDDQLWIKAEGQSSWETRGRISVSGAELLVTSSDGAKTFYERLVRGRVN